MNFRSIALAALMTSSAMGLAHAAGPTPSPAPAQDAKVDHALGKLSTDGATAFRDIHMARLALFDAEPAKAKSLIEKAQASLNAAKRDDTAYLKADGDLKPTPPQRDAASAGTASPAPAGGQPIAWLPIDGQLVLGEDLVSTPEKKAAVKSANEQLQAGDRKTATKTLKAADIDVSFTMAVVPLEQTVSSVDHAASLLGDGKYYEANAALKQLEESVRFDTIVLDAG